MLPNEPSSGKTREKYISASDPNNLYLGREKESKRRKTGSAVRAAVKMGRNIRRKTRRIRSTRRKRNKNITRSTDHDPDPVRKITIDRPKSNTNI